jgi:hypothetical protein
MILEPLVPTLTGRKGYDRVSCNWTPYPEWWRDRPFEATATGSNMRNAGANSRPRVAGAKIR